MNDFSPSAGSQFGSVESLANKLGLSTEKLIYISENVDNYWLKGKTIIKSDGSKRTTHNAKPELKGIHQSIKEKILLPTFYPKFLHGALPKRSVFSNAQNHTCKKVLISEDIANFFPNTNEKLINQIWQKFYRCPPDVARILTLLTSYKDMLPQGWKTSSYLANLVFWDTELDLYSKLYKKGFIYSRFVDDISLSTRRSYSKAELTKMISDIHCLFASKGYQLKRTKHQIKTNSSRQLVNNQLVNGNKVGIPREKRRIIRALVHQLEVDYNHGAADMQLYEIKWQKTCAKVGQLKSGHSEQYSSLRAVLDIIKPFS